MATITLGADGQTFLFERNGQYDSISDFRSLYFESTLDEAQEVPPNGDIAGIDGTGTGVRNFARTEFDFSLDINGIDLSGGPALDDMTDMHIHGGEVGVAGPIVFSFLNDAETVVNAGAGTVTGSWDANEAVAEDMTTANVAALNAGDTYFNIHTNRDPSGFIRGQILRDGTGGDFIDLRELNIGSFETLQAITGQVAGDAVIRAYFDGDDSAITLDGIGLAALRPGHFIFAGNVAETVDGTDRRDDLFGAGGNDTVNGGGGKDRLFGENGNDTISGSLGRDALIGGLGLDVLTGDEGPDRFVFKDTVDSSNTAADADRVTDFAVNSDLIVLSAIDASTALAGNQAFTFVDTGPFDAEGQIRVTHSRGDTIAFLNTTDQNGAEMAIRLDGNIGLGEMDFIL